MTTTKQITDVTDASAPISCNYVKEITVTEMDRQQFLSARKEAGRNIDPKTAEICWHYALTIDPYGIYPELPEEFQQVGREYFARSPDNDIWSTSEICRIPHAMRCGGNT